MTRVLVVDDDPGLRDIVRFALEQEGMSVVEAADGEAALREFPRVQPAVIVLDVMMPKVDGVQVCREIRRSSDVPILFLSARDDEIDRVLGLEMGGDDYVSKPFSPRELTARVKALLRRLDRPRGAEEATPKILEHGRLKMDEGQFRAFWDGDEVVLTVTEFGILRALLARPGMVLTRDRLMDEGYGVDKYVSDRTIDSHIRRVRRKFDALGADVIETVHGLGYKLGPC